MELKYEVTEEDMIRGILYDVKNSPERKKVHYMNRYLLAASLGFLLFNLGEITPIGNKLFWTVFATLFILIWIIMYPKYCEKHIRKTMKKVKLNY